MVLQAAVCSEFPSGPTCAECLFLYCSEMHQLEVVRRSMVWPATCVGSSAC